MFKRPGTSRPHLRRAAPAGFTLVEMLTVIVIIGILMALVSGAVVTARAFAIQSRVRLEMDQLKIALMNYQAKYGEFPPEATDPGLFVRHVNRIFPNYVIVNKSGAAVSTAADKWDSLVYWFNQRWGLNLNQLRYDPAACLVFWLGGYPYQGRLSGFSDNPADPFDFKSRATGRLTPWFEFQESRLVAVNTWLRYVPDFGGSITAQSAPYVYFRARSKGLDLTQAAATATPGYDPVGKLSQFQNPPDTPQLFNFVGASGTETVYPYCKGVNCKLGNLGWVEPKGFQLFCAGSDGSFGKVYALPLGYTQPNASLRFKWLKDVYGDGSSVPAFSGGEYDNVATFTTDRMEDIK